MIRVYLKDMGGKVFALARGLAVSALFVWLWTWLVPSWINGGRLEPRLSVAALVFMIPGGAIMLWCVLAFAWRGLGTPMPLDPPRRLVVMGLYRFVRNPMYVGMGLFLCGEALLLPSITRQMFIMVVLLWGAVTILIVTYEEPGLRRRFGADYETYYRNVARWIPRLTPFDNAPTEALH
jgi:protein-S-isoprenylcysteine O-methyltransferase Ste14